MADVLAFSCAGVLVGISLDAVVGVDPLGPLTRVPGAPAHLRGIANRQGSLLPVFDLVALLSTDAPTRPPGAWLVVLRDGALIAGVDADEVPTVVRISDPGGPAQAGSPPDVVREGPLADDRHTQAQPEMLHGAGEGDGTVQLGSANINLLDPGALLAMARLSVPGERA